MSKLDENIKNQLRSIVFPSKENIEAALDQTIKTMEDTKFKEKYDESVKTAFSSLYDTTIRFLKLGKKINKLDKDKQEKIVIEIIPYLMNTDIDFILNVVTMADEFSNKTIDVLDELVRSHE